MNDLHLVLITFPSIDSARQIGTVLMEKQLAACVNLIAGIESIYRWQGKVESSTEVLGIFKTRMAVFPQFERTIQELHPYEIPEIVVIKPETVSQNYLAWVLHSTSGQSQ